MKRIAIIEDDIELKELLEKFLNFQKDFSCEISVESMEDFLNIYEKYDSPDVIISDIGLPGMNGIEGLPILKKKLPNTEIVMLTVHDDSDKVFQSLCKGASGYLQKNTPLDKIKESIDTVLTGGSPMSPNIARRIVEHFNPNPKVGEVKCVKSAPK